MDERFCDVGDGITLCYETFGDPADETALLIMGLGTQMVAWQEDFCRDLAARGFHVVRFDNRDIGHSTHLQGPPPTIRQLLLRSRSAAHYKLSDMAEDAAGLLRELELSPAHVIGASMGGMIAQTLAARHPKRVRSLTSIMSNTGALTNGQPALKLYPFFLRRPTAGREQYVTHFERLFNAIGSRGLPREPQEIRELAAISYERDHDPAGPGRQLAAILASGDRTSELRRIEAPTLVVHGTADPLVRPSGGRATAKAIKGAKLLTIDRMGHDMPRVIWPQLMDAIAENAARAGGPPDRHPPPRASRAPLSGLSG
jgi:pimeloyl-ACP methyl ester carboxylesterase